MLRPKTELQSDAVVMMMKMNQIWFVLAMVTALAGRTDIANAGPAGHPVIVELFTSQGCYSCPPADRFLWELRRRDGVLALAYNIDYWNYIRWKDPFALPTVPSGNIAMARR